MWQSIIGLNVFFDPQGPGAIGGLDVQAIMDRAIELRRKAIEESESEDEGEGDEGEWSDEG